MSVSKAVIPAAGLGSRLRPITRAVPKELFPVLNVPLIQLIVAEAVSSGIEEIVIVVNEHKSAIQDYFAAGNVSEQQASDGMPDVLRRADIRFVDQPQPLGLGHAVLMAANAIGHSPFAVLLGDNLTRAPSPVIGQLIDVYKKYQGAVIGVEQVPQERTGRYGIVETQQGEGNIQRIEKLIEKPAPGETDSNLAIAGRYVLPPEIFECLGRSEKGRGGEIQLTDAIADLLTTEPGFACQYLGERLDLGSPSAFIRANILAALDRPDLREEVIRVLSEIQTQLPCIETSNDE